MEYQPLAPCGERASNGVRSVFVRIVGRSFRASFPTKERVRANFRNTISIHLSCARVLYTRVKMCVRARARLASGQVRRGEKSKYGNRRKTKRSGMCEKVREKER